MDPNAPLDPMPDLGVDWPDMNAPDVIAPLDATEPAADATETKAAEVDSTKESKYSVVLEGLQGSMASGRSRKRSIRNRRFAKAMARH
ncbi:hypothetical protein [Sphingomonas daechungensis]|uniref:hypothetical protein n=1 Tax=Sphingomonas daechungensis TaxID=1176646 RepID=UPI001CB91971|nr:hypothetical protein [Sphingomonas daechungensis]